MLTRAHMAAAVAVTMAAACVPTPDPPLVEPGEWLPGGDTTNTLLLGRNAFLRPAENITDDNELRFFSGNSFFNQAWVTAPASTTARDGLGPLFNARSCAACHPQDGRGAPPGPNDDPTNFQGLLLRITTASGDPHSQYGGQLQPFGVGDIPGEAVQSVTYTPIAGQYDDGTPYELMQPTYAITDWAYGEPEVPVHISPRVGPQMIGLGLLDAIPDARLDELADPDDADGDGISGERGVGRFGWRATQPSVRHQVADAFLHDLGITSPLLPTDGCTDVQPACKAAPNGGDPEIDDDLLEKVTVYSSLGAVPIRRDWEDPGVLAGKKHFHAIGCASCHVPSHITGAHELAEVSNQKIWPYTDLLLHDMGEELADDVSSQWRTPPLWGLGLVPAVNKHQQLLHDGRARGVAEAILWHGGEAEVARNRFRALNAQARDELVTFVNSL